MFPPLFLFPPFLLALLMILCVDRFSSDLYLFIELFHYSDITDESPVNWSKLLVFWTGADAPPPLGFATKLKICFYTAIDGERRLPTSSTCGMVLFLPRGMSEPEQLSEMLTYAVANSGGFGLL
jgi:HECT-domain (ubiquitin-transferase)